LPAHEEAHQRRGAHRLDLAPQPREREAMDAREHAAVAPLDIDQPLVIVGRGERFAHGALRGARVGGRERAAQDRTVAFECE
jgi:hypothetical protein